MSISNWFSSERKAELCLTLLLARAWPCLKDLQTSWQSSESSFYPNWFLHLQSQVCPPRHNHWETTLTTGHHAICAAATDTVYQKHVRRSTVQAQFLEDSSSDWNIMRKSAEKLAQRRGLPAVSFSSSSASSLRSCSFPTAWVAGTVTPGIWGRQHGGVRARGEFRQSRRNFLS